MLSMANRTQSYQRGESINIRCLQSTKDIYVLLLYSSSISSEEVEMRPLTIDNVPGIHDLYPASEIECVEVFEKLVRTLPGFGVFTKNTGELCAWMMHSYYGAMFSMQTKPEFRRKG